MRRDGIIFLSKLLIRSGPYARGSNHQKAAKDIMTDEEKIKKDAAEGGIEFNPPVPEIYGDAAAPIPEGGDRLAVPADTIAEDVGLQLNPALRKPAGTSPDFKQILQEVKLPERRASPKSAPPFASPSSSPQVGANAPEISPLQKETPVAVQAADGEPDHSPVVSLHTMKDDIQDAVRDQQISMVRAASLEADKRVHAAPPPKPITVSAEKGKAKKRHLFLPVSMVVLFLALGGGALYAAYFFAVQKVTPIPTTTGIIFAEQQSALPIGAETEGALKQTLASMLASQGSGGGSILHVTATVSGASGEPPRKATLEEFFHALGARPPDELLRALDSDFFFGIHAADTPSTIFIVPVTAFDHAFAGMLSWEAGIDADPQPLFRQLPVYLPMIASSTIPARRTFQDYLIRNYDVRILRDDAGEIVLYYSFPTQRLLIIASSPYTFPEVLSRLQAQRKL